MFCRAWSLGERRFWMRLVDSSEGGMEFCCFWVWLVFTFSVLSLNICSGLFVFWALFFRGSELEEESCGFSFWALLEVLGGGEGSWGDLASWSSGVAVTFSTDDEFFIFAVSLDAISDRSPILSQIGSSSESTPASAWGGECPDPESDCSISRSTIGAVECSKTGV